MDGTAGFKASNRSRPTLHGVLIIVESGDRGEASRIDHPQKLEMFSLVARDGLRARTTDGSRQALAETRP